MSTRAVVRVLVEVYGRVPMDFVENIRQVLDRVYAGVDLPHVVYVKLFEDGNSMIRALRTADVYEDESYLAFHDARDGLPKIYVAYDVMSRLDPKVMRGVLMHEAAHAVLHGNVLSYLVTGLGECSRLAEELGANSQQLAALIYYLSVAIKDYDVVKYIIERGLAEDYTDYVNYMLDVDSEEVSAIERMGEGIGMLLALAILLKQYATAKPFHHVDEVRRRLEELLNRLPERYREALIDLGESLESSNEDLSGRLNIACSAMRRLSLHTQH